MSRRASPSKVFELLFIVALVLAVRAISAADTLGSISGMISANGASVTVSVVCGNVAKSTTTTGSFSIGGLPSGTTCTVSASAPGFQGASTRVAVGGSVSLSLVAKVTPKREPKPAEEMEKRPMPPPPAKPSPMMRREMVKGRMGPPASIAPSSPAPMAYDTDNGLEGKNTEAYARIDDNPFHRVATAPLSTFSVDVDTASYANLRRFLREGSLPPKDAVRIEEMINYFTYDYPQPQKGEPFSITTEVTASPWNDKLSLVRIGLKAPAIDDAKVPARNLVFLLDVSGSMSSPNKLPLLRQAMTLLVNQLRPQDKIAIVTYAGNAGLVLPATNGREKDTIRSAIARLEPGGSTNGAAGIELAYQIAEANAIKGGINRVILATDGDFNVGTTSEGDLTRLIEKKRERGVFLTVLGFGMGNLKDATMEKLADRGNGNYAYIDDLDEARKVLVKEAGATLVTVAKDVKLQIEFNPATVAGYRLIGYENRLLRDEDFNDDKKDAGDIGAGHSVTALYEIVPAGVPVPAAKVDDLKYQQKPAPAPASASQELLTVKIRYKEPDGKTSKLLARPLPNNKVELAKTSVDLRWAAAMAGFGMMLRESPHRGNMSWLQVQAMAKGAVGTDAEGYRMQALVLIDQAMKLSSNKQIAK